MKLDFVNMIEVIPPYMQGDSTVIGLCAAANHIFTKLYECIAKMDFYNNLDLLDDSDLDYIADIKNIVWYDKSSTKEVKINVIKNAEKVFWYLGTVSAAESVMNDIFGECEIQEWFEYNGIPYHFKILTYNPQITENAVNKFTNAIKHVKRKSAIFDNVEIALSADYMMNYGFKMYSGELLTLTQEG